MEEGCSLFVGIPGMFTIFFGCWVLWWVSYLSLIIYLSLSLTPSNRFPLYLSLSLIIYLSIRLSLPLIAFPFISLSLSLIINQSIYLSLSNRFPLNLTLFLLYILPKHLKVCPSLPPSGLVCGVEFRGVDVSVSLLTHFHGLGCVLGTSKHQKWFVQTFNVENIRESNNVHLPRDCSAFHWHQLVCERRAGCRSSSSTSAATEAEGYPQGTRGRGPPWP